MAIQCITTVVITTDKKYIERAQPECVGDPQQRQGMGHGSALPGIDVLTLYTNDTGEFGRAHVTGKTEDPDAVRVIVHRFHNSYYYHCKNTLSSRK
jgi:hypothetical protein